MHANKETLLVVYPQVCKQHLWIWKKFHQVIINLPAMAHESSKTASFLSFLEN